MEGNANKLMRIRWIQGIKRTIRLYENGVFHSSTKQCSFCRIADVVTLGIDDCSGCLLYNARTGLYCIDFRSLDRIMNRLDKDAITQEDFNGRIAFHKRLLKRVQNAPLYRFSVAEMTKKPWFKNYNQ